jgi:hypothetical protein
MYDPALATRPYPRELHAVKTVDMQVFRRDTDIEIVNATPQSYSNFDLWINQRYVKHVESLPAGESITLSLWDFFDEHGDRFNAGGFFRAFEPTPVRLVQIQPQTSADENSGSDGGGAMVGLISIRREEITLPPLPGQ